MVIEDKELIRVDLHIEKMEKKIETAVSDARLMDEREPITVWIPADFKRRYRKLQSVTNNGMSKALKRIILSAINSACKKYDVS